MQAEQLAGRLNMTSAKYDSSNYLEDVISSAEYYLLCTAAFSEGLTSAVLDLSLADNPYCEDDCFEARQNWFGGYLLSKPTAAFELGVAAGEANAATGEYLDSPFFEDVGIGAQAWMYGFSQASAK